MEARLPVLVAFQEFSAVGHAIARLGVLYVGYLAIRHVLPRA